MGLMHLQTGIPPFRALAEHGPCHVQQVFHVVGHHRQLLNLPLMFGIDRVQFFVDRMQRRIGALDFPEGVVWRRRDVGCSRKRTRVCGNTSCAFGVKPACSGQPQE